MQDNTGAACYVGACLIKSDIYVEHILPVICSLCRAHSRNTRLRGHVSRHSEQMLKVCSQADDMFDLHINSYM